MSRRYSLVLFCLFPIINSFAQLQVSVDSVALRLAKIIVGPGIPVSNAMLTGPYGEAGTFSGNTNLGIDSGVILTNGYAVSAIGPNNTMVSQAWYTAGDSDLAAAIGQPDSNLYDACALEFDIVVPFDSIAFNYVFGSEEYPDYVCSDFDDAFGLFIEGPGINGFKNIALVPGTNTPVSINTVNNGLGPGLGSTVDSCPPIVYPQYFINNGTYDSLGAGNNVINIYEAPNDTSPYYIQYNGFTTVLTASIGGLTLCAKYHLKMVVADVGDPFNDSGIFLRARFRSTSTVNIAALGIPYTTGTNSDTAMAGCSKGVFPFQLLNPAISDTVLHFTIEGTASNGIDYAEIPDSIIFHVGDSIQNLYVVPLASSNARIKAVNIVFVTACGFLDTATLYISNKLNLLVSPHDTTICNGQSVGLMASDSLGEYTWSPSAGLSDTGISNPVVNPLGATTYTCSCFINGCTASDTAHISIAPAFEVLIIPRDSSICPGTQILVLNAGVFNTYLWQNNSTAQFLSVSDSGLYRVTVSDSMGCKSTDSVQVLFSCPDKLVLPNAFTPNGDGKDDVFKPLYYTPPASFHMHIYDRWGVLLFESNNAAVGWDGTFNGKAQPSGTYVYYIQYLFTGEKQQNIQGALELLR